VSRYTVYVIPCAWKEIKDLPGNVRQRVRRAVDALADNPWPPKSKKLKVPDFEPELHRLRLDRWRIVYAITEDDSILHIEWPDSGG
jgi:mRNA interferase RelE/StbE